MSASGSQRQRGGARIGSGSDEEARKSGRARPAKASAALIRKQQLGLAPVGGGRQQMMDTGFETIRMPAGGLQKLSGAVVGPEDAGQQGEVLQDVYKIIRAAHISGEELWNGAQSVRPLIKHFNKELRTGKLHETTLVNFVFPKTPEFAGRDAKTYKVERMMPIARLVAMVLGRLGVEHPERFTLSTLGGFVLPDAHRLADYGLGSLLPNWELLVVDKAEAEAQAAREKAEAEAAQRADGPTLSQGATRVSLLIAFIGAGWPVRLQRLLISPEVSIGAIIETLVARHGYKALPPEKLAFASLDDDPVDSSATLANYGLGRLIGKWAVKLGPAEDAELPQEAPASPRDDSALVAKLRAELASAHAREAELLEANEKSMKRAVNLRTHLEGEKVALKAALDTMTQEHDELASAHRRLQADVEREAELHAKKIEALETQVKELRERRAEDSPVSEEQELLELSLSNFTSVIENLEMELAHAQTRAEEAAHESALQVERLKERTQTLTKENAELHSEVVRLQEALEKESKERESEARRARDLEQRVHSEATLAPAELHTPLLPEEPILEEEEEDAQEDEEESRAAEETPRDDQAELGRADETPADLGYEYEPFEPESELVRQWVHAIEGVSSQAADLDEGYDDWAATQLIGPPKVTGYGDSGLAWAPFDTNGGAEWVTLRFRRRVLMREILVLESWNPGALCKVEVKGPDGFVSIWERTPENAPAQLRIVRVVPKRLLTFASDTVKLHLDTSTVGGNEWNEIAAVQVAGVPVEPEPEPEPVRIGAPTGPPPPPPPPMTLATTAPKRSVKGKSAASTGDLMGDLKGVVQLGRSALRSAQVPHAAQKVRSDTPADTIAAVLLKRFNAVHGTGQYEDLGSQEDWDVQGADDAEWDDDDVW